MDTGGDTTAGTTATQERIPTGAPPHTTRPAPPRRRRWLRGLLAVLALLLLSALSVAAWAYYRTEQTLDSIERIPDALPTLPDAEQPAPAAGDAQIYLLVGLDAETRPSGAADEQSAPAWQPGVARSDTMMLLHLPADRSSATVVSIPRDTWVDVPGHGMAKLNAAYSWGGPPLMVETIQNLTDLRVDHLAVLDWSGFRDLTDAVGGVDLDGRRMTGDQALVYVRERKTLPNGDFDRTRRQHAFLQALLAQTLSGDTLTSPSRLNGLLDTVGDVVSVDAGLTNADIRSLAWDLRELRPGAITFMNAPVLGTDTIAGQSVVHLDAEEADALWQAMRTDTVADHLVAEP